MFIVHYCWVQNILYIHHIAPLTNFHVNITYVFIIHYKHSLPASFAFYKHKNIVLYANIIFPFSNFTKKSFSSLKNSKKTNKTIFHFRNSEDQKCREVAEIVLIKKYNPCCHINITEIQKWKYNCEKRCFLQFFPFF